MPNQPRQLSLELPGTHGGRRKGAGRSNRSGLRAHTKRPRLSGREPLHVTIKLQPGLPSLRRKDVLRCLREAVRKARGKGLAVIHFAILSNHAHFILETRNERALGRGLQSLGISFSKRLNALLEREGAVLLGRYHVHALKTPSEVRNALRYVVSNEQVHVARQLRSRPRLAMSGNSEFSSTGILLPEDWNRLFGARFPKVNLAPSALEELLAPPTTWLLRTGWKRVAR